MFKVKRCKVLIQWLAVALYTMSNVSLNKLHRESQRRKSSQCSDSDFSKSSCYNWRPVFLIRLIISDPADQLRAYSAHGFSFSAEESPNSLRKSAEV